MLIPYQLVVVAQGQQMGQLLFMVLLEVYKAATAQVLLLVALAVQG